jgi:hypothetical protein
MTDATSSSEDARNRTRHAVAELLAGSGLQVRELAHELVITNPVDPERGQIRVEYADGHVSWERVTWTYWGTLEGFADVGEDMISGQRIVDALDPRRA